MSNPFEKLFAHDPDAQQRQAAFQAATQEQRARDELKRHFELETKRLDSMVIEVLEQLRVAVYPHLN